MSIATNYLQRLFQNLLTSLLCIISPTINALFKRIRADPGLPLPNPSLSYWMNPPSPDIATAAAAAAHGKLPIQKADVVIIGSGITGTAVARTILDLDDALRRDAEARQSASVRNPSNRSTTTTTTKWKPITVVMLEARDVCSGATGRNGGHITPVLYHDYPDLLRAHGTQTAKSIIHFRLAHFARLFQVATEEEEEKEEEGLLEHSQCRQVDAFDVYHNSEAWEDAKRRLEVFKEAFPEKGASFKVYEGERAIKELDLSNRTIGCISTKAGAIHPYRFVTGILKRLLDSYPNFQLFTHTPCTEITIISPHPSPAAANPTTSRQQPHHQYLVSTPEGKIQTTHIIHATNAWASHLLPSMREKIIPARGTMTAQAIVPRAGFDNATTMGENTIATTTTTEEEEGTTPRDWTGMRSFVFYPARSFGEYDYLTQQMRQGGLVSDSETRSAGSSSGSGSGSSPSPSSRKGIGNGEFMFGGGFKQVWKSELGNVDDTGYDKGVARRLEEVLLGRYFANDHDRDHDHREGEERDGEGDGNTTVSSSSTVSGMTKKTKKRVFDSSRLSSVGAWSGLLGISADLQPWVGRIPEELTRRRKLGVPANGGGETRSGEALDLMKVSGDGKARGGGDEGGDDIGGEEEEGRRVRLALPGEWIAAGYSGEGMVHAWLSGEAIGEMVVLGDDSDDDGGGGDRDDRDDESSSGVNHTSASAGAGAGAGASSKEMASGSTTRNGKPFEFTKGNGNGNGGVRIPDVFKVTVGRWEEANVVTSYIWG